MNPCLRFAAMLGAVWALACTDHKSGLGDAGSPPSDAGSAGVGDVSQRGNSDAAASGQGGRGGVGGAAVAGTGGAAVGGTAGSPGSTNPCTGVGTLAAGDTNATLAHGGVDRQYIIHVPASYDGRTRVPLVLDIHGLTSNAAQQEGLSGWRQKSDSTGFIVVYPNGLNASWNGGSLCCGQSRTDGVDDEGFLRAAVAKMQQDACIDGKRIYATGLSNGGAMAHLLACRAADLFAASAPVSMGNGTMPCQPSRPISVVMFRGTTDPLVAYNGGVFPGAQADFDQWSGLDGCTGQPQTTHGLCSTHSGCQAGVEVTLCTIDAGHVLYAQAAAQQAPVPDVVWEAFARHTLP